MSKETKEKEEKVEVILEEKATKKNEKSVEQEIETASKVVISLTLIVVALTILTVSTVFFVLIQQIFVKPSTGKVDKNYKQNNPIIRKLK